MNVTHSSYVLGASGIRSAYQSQLSESSGSSQASSLANSRSSEAEVGPLDATQHLEQELFRRDAKQDAEVDPLEFLVKDWWAHKDSPETDKMPPLTPKLDEQEDASSEPLTPKGENGLRTPLADGLRAIREQCRKGSTSPVDFHGGIRTPDLRTPIRTRIGNIRGKLAEALPAEDAIAMTFESVLPSMAASADDSILLEHVMKKLQTVREVWMEDPSHASPNHEFLFLLH